MQPFFVLVSHKAETDHRMNKMRKLILASVFMCLALMVKAETEVHVVLDTSGSMSSKLPAISQGLEQFMHSEIGQKVEFTFYSFTDEVTLLGKQTQGDLLTKIKTFGATGRIEDGFVPIQKILSSDIAPHASLLLFTDENRDVVQDIDLDSLVQQALEKKVEIQVVVNQAVDCGGERGIAIDAMGMAIDPKGNNIKCPQHEISNKAKDSYLQLALATGGLVWDVNGFEPHQHLKKNTTQVLQPAQMADIFSSIMQQKIARKVSQAFDVEVDISGITRVGENVYFDASRSVAKNPDDKVFEWRWDFNGDGEVDDVGSMTSWYFNQSGKHSVHLTLEGRSGVIETEMLIVNIEI